MNEQTEQQTQNQAIMSGPTILVTDDEEAVRHLLREVLENDGYTVIEAGNGLEALRAVRRERIDLVILDLVMPEQEGIETLGAFRRDHPYLRVLAISGAFGGSCLRSARILGANAVLKKPFSCDALLSSVKSLLQPVESGG